MAKKILIVDDSSSVRTVARMALREKGYDVVEASNGQEALSKLDAQFGSLFHTQDFLEGVKAQAEGRKPVYQGK